jgi:hypothetical protein
MAVRQMDSLNNQPNTPIESLEPRQLLAAEAIFTTANGFVTVTGTGKSDDIIVRNIQFNRSLQLEDSDIVTTSAGDELIEVSINNEKFYFDRDRVNRIQIFGFAGSDVIASQQDDRTESQSVVENEDNSIAASPQAGR